ncbi:hypothetical protein L1049_016444 [Liquidambar formosana]|uniref:Uncharacterized protein n=1 Tax=Liquidambar formosana TaxID=63359 RepID=A0AAP0S0T7_LIQFO
MWGLFCLQLNICWEERKNMKFLKGKGKKEMQKLNVCQFGWLKEMGRSNGFWPFFSETHVVSSFLPFLLNNASPFSSQHYTFWKVVTLSLLQTHTHILSPSFTHAFHSSILYNGTKLL